MSRTIEVFAKTELLSSSAIFMSNPYYALLTHARPYRKVGDLLMLNPVF